jgi:hypothetical protein
MSEAWTYGTDSGPIPALLFLSEPDDMEREFCSRSRLSTRSPKVWAGGSSPGFCCGRRAQGRDVWTVRSSRTVWMCLFSKVEQLQSPFQLFCSRRSLFSRVRVPVELCFSGCSGRSRRHTDNTDRGRDDCQSGKESEYVERIGTPLFPFPRCDSMILLSRFSHLTAFLTRKPGMCRNLCAT